MHLIAVSQVIRSILSLVAAIVVLALSVRLTWVAGAIALVGGVMLLVCDFPMLRHVARTKNTSPSIRVAPHWRNAVQLAKLTLPLGFSALIVSFNANVPRYFISHLHGEEDLGFFVGVAYMTMAGNFLVSSVAQAVMPRMAQYYKSGDFASLRSVLWWLSAFAIGIGLAGTLLSAFAGREILTWVYRPEYAPYSALLTLLACAATFGFEASILNAAMGAVREFSQQLPLFIATTAATSVACFLLIPSLGLNGAALAVTVGYSLQAGGAVVIVIGALRRRAVTEVA